MNKNLSFLNFADEDEKRVVSHALELAERSRDSQTRVSSFLNIREQKLVKTALLSDGSFCFAFYGGFKDAERRVLVCFPEYVMYSMLLEPGCIDSSDDTIYDLCKESCEDSIALLRISCSDFVKLTHRDYMGAILSLGIDRSTLGDIVPDTDHDAYVFVTAKMAQYISDNLTSVGRTPVKVTVCDSKSTVRLKHNTVSSQAVATSLRFDCVVSAITGISRDKSKTLIKQGLAELNYYAKASPDDTVGDGDIISVRGYGKYKIANTNDTTSKGKSRITVLKYI
ncbi:MAG: hypothetical protein IJ391_04890 [Clostridia bacterium]|nr:hypothetical protein [Clostridia bacterium]